MFEAILLEIIVRFLSLLFLLSRNKIAAGFQFCKLLDKIILIYFNKYIHITSVSDHFQSWLLKISHTVRVKPKYSH